MKRLIRLAAVLCVAGLALAQSGGDPPPERARKAFLAGDYVTAEKSLRQVVKDDPADVLAWCYLGHSLFRQEKYADALAPYAKAMELDRDAKKLTLTERRVLTDQLVTSYGISGQLKKAHDLLDIAIRNDSDYPMNYYNLACTYGEEGNKTKVLANLQLAYDRKANMTKGETMPDPRGDSSFEKYKRDPDFIKLMEKLGYK